MMTSQTSATTATLRTLHQNHRQLADLQERLERGPRMAQAHQANVRRLEALLAKLEQEALSLRMATDQKQGQLASREATLQKRHLQLRQASNNAEYQALKDEIAATQMANSVLEDEILEAFDQLDELAANVQQAKNEVAKARHEADKASQDAIELDPQIRSQIERLGTEMKRCEDNLPGDFRELYRRVVRQKGEDALASVRGEFCDGCHQHVPVNLINQLLLNRPATCKACGRLLYLPEDYVPR
jgi:predicted  nucleic acid-binding Zn-ribbon protein